MKKKTLINTFSVLTLTSLFSFAGLNNVNAQPVNESVKVNKVNINNEFALGMDISSIISLEKGGVTYYDENGKKEDLFKLCSENGTNYIRVRIWNNPKNSKGVFYGGGNNDLNTAIQIGKRATNANMKVLVDLHYSDFWTDPGKFIAPKDWSKLDPSAVSGKIYDWTKEVLDKFAAEKINVGMIQIGNEINTGFVSQYTWSPGNGGLLNENYCNYLNSGLSAVSDFNNAHNTSIKKVLHFTEPNKACGTIFAKLEKCGVKDYDVFATSYYPDIHGDLDSLYSTLMQIGDTTKKQIMVAEYNYPYIGSSDKSKYPFGVSVKGQASFIRSLVNTVNSIDYNFDNVSDGIGVFYWEPAWPKISEWEKYGTGWANKSASDYLDHQNNGFGFGQTPTDRISLFASKSNNRQQMLDSFKTYKYLKIGKKKLNTIKSISISKNSEKISLKWSKSSGASTYKIYRSDGTNGIFTLIGTTAKTSYTDKNVKAGHTYLYSVKAFAANGIDSSDGTDEITIYVPKTIKKINAKKKNGKTKLKWKKDSYVSGYIVYKSNKSNGKYKVLKTIKSASKNSYSIKSNKKAFYKVRAFYQIGKKKIFGKLSKAVKVK